MSVNDIVTDVEIAVLLEKTSKMTEKLTTFADHVNLSSRRQLELGQGDVKIDLSHVNECIKTNFSTMQKVRDCCHLGSLPRWKYDLLMLMVTNGGVMILSLEVMYHDIIHVSDTMKLVKATWNEKQDQN
jgi:hypothetical protein